MYRRQRGWRAGLFKLFGAQVVLWFLSLVFVPRLFQVFALLDFNLAIVLPFHTMPIFFSFEMGMFYCMSCMLEACYFFVRGAHS